jgi:hypothetical protein
MLAADSVLSGSFPARAFIAFSFATSPQSPNGLSLSRYQQAEKKNKLFSLKKRLTIQKY